MAESKEPFSQKKFILDIWQGSQYASGHDYLKSLNSDFNLANF